MSGVEFPGEIRRVVGDGELSEEAVAAFDRAYGLVPRPEKLYWYRLLDEFFQPRS